MAKETYVDKLKMQIGQASAKVKADNYFPLIGDTVTMNAETKWGQTSEWQLNTGNGTTTEDGNLTKQKDSHQVTIASDGELQQKFTVENYLTEAEVVKTLYAMQPQTLPYFDIETTEVARVGDSFTLRTVPENGYALACTGVCRIYKENETENPTKTLTLSPGTGISVLETTVSFSEASERGIYDTNTDQAELLNRSILTNGGRKLTGDSLFYDRRAGYGEAFDNVQMNDTVNRNMLTGDYCFYNELTENAVATRRAVAVDYSQGDSLFMHADTLRLITFNLNTDSVYREMRAYHKVRAYRTDVQAVCDSMVYNSKDSCLTMYTDPILWQGPQQLLGEEIKVYMNDSTIDWAHIISQALAIEQKDSVHYNQVSGKEMMAYFQEGEMRRVEVNGNVLVVYYPVEERDSSLIGMDYTEGSFLRMLLRDRRMERGSFIGKATGTMYPMDQIPPDKMRLPAFVWFDYIRPVDKEDIFNWRGKRADQVLQKSDRRPAASP